MKGALVDLLGSKRFLVITLTVLVLASFTLTGKLPPERFLDEFTKLYALLAALYGLENTAQALRVAPSDPAPLITPPASPPPSDVSTTSSNAETIVPPPMRGPMRSGPR